MGSYSSVEKQEFFKVPKNAVYLHIERHGHSDWLDTHSDIGIGFLTPDDMSCFDDLKAYDGQPQEPPMWNAGGYVSGQLWINVDDFKVTISEFFDKATYDLPSEKVQDLCKEIGDDLAQEFFDAVTDDIKRLLMKRISPDNGGNHDD